MQETIPKASIIWNDLHRRDFNRNFGKKFCLFAEFAGHLSHTHTMYSILDGKQIHVKYCMQTVWKQFANSLHTVWK